VLRRSRKYMKSLIKYKHYKWLTEQKLNCLKRSKIHKSGQSRATHFSWPTSSRSISRRGVAPPSKLHTNTHHRLLIYMPVKLEKYVRPVRNRNPNPKPDPWPSEVKFGTPVLQPCETTISIWVFTPLYLCANRPYGTDGWIRPIMRPTNMAA